ncbi:erythromycin esterase family protein [Cytobacillus firmus]|uniref:erythromycin esterase family protein n=1 Tax=Cytobacillus firmus TaxID=1399 RepID=UPI003B9E0A33
MFNRKRDIQGEIDWLQKNVSCIKPGDSNDDSDLSFLKPLLQDKRIVLLGENGHGVKEHTEIKSRLIKYLYQELDFRVLVFESSLGACSFSSKQRVNSSKEQLVKQSLFKVWHTKEMVELFTWIKATESSESSMIISGFDIQPSPIENITSEVLMNLFFSIGEVYGNQIQKLEQDILHQYVHSRNSTMSKKERKMKQKELRESYQSLLLLLKQNYTYLQEKFDQETLKIAERVLRNRVQLVDMIAASFMKAIKLRNKMMADNIVWLVQEMFAGEKIIIWSHNNHISKKMKGMIGFKSTFSYVPTEVKQNSYSIGFFMYSGNAADNSRKIYEVKEPEQDSIEYRMQKLGHDVGFLDISKQSKIPENQWLFKYSYTMDEGRDLTLIRPHACFDGLINCSKVNAPTYLEL